MGGGVGKLVKINNAFWFLMAIINARFIACHLKDTYAMRVYWGRWGMLSSCMPHLTARRRLPLAGKKSVCLLVLLPSRSSKYIHWPISFLFFWPALRSHPNALRRKLFMGSPRIATVGGPQMVKYNFLLPQTLSMWKFPSVHNLLPDRQHREFKLSSVWTGPSDTAVSNSCTSASHSRSSELGRDR